MWRISVDPMYRRQDGWRRPAGLTIEAVEPLRFLAAIDADWNFTRILVRRGLQRQPARPTGESVTADRWEDVEKQLHQARLLAPDERAGFVANIGDADVRAEVASLLTAEGGAVRRSFATRSPKLHVLPNRKPSQAGCLAIFGSSNCWAAEPWARCIWRRT